MFTDIKISEDAIQALNAVYSVELGSGSGIFVHESESEIFRNKIEGGGGQEAPDPGFYCKNIEI